MLSEVMFSSEKDEWGTPDSFYNPMHEIFQFELDVCASEKNAKCKKYYDEEMDGLSRVWSGHCWMNPPYSVVSDWMEKACDVGNKPGNLVACLVATRTETLWWQNYVKPFAQAILHIKGRLCFVAEGSPNMSAPFPSSLVIYQKEPLSQEVLISLSQYGHVLQTFYPPVTSSIERISDAGSWF